MKRHIGKIASTDQRCVIAYMQLPGREDHALVIPTDALPARYEQAVMDIVESNEGQADETLANVLSRRIMPDTGKSVLQTLHEQRYLQPVPVSNVLMLPQPNMPFPLEQILTGLRRTIPQNSNPRYADAAMQKYNPHTANQRADNLEETTAMAKNLLVEADMLQESADMKRKQAYQIAPHLQPNTTLPTNAAVTDAYTAPATAEKKVSVKKARPSRRKTAEKAA